jgi:hypothetical protein
VRNLDLLDQLDPQLASVIFIAGHKWEKNTGLTLRVTSGFRTAKEQMDLFLGGKSKTTNSRHMYGEAVDLAVLRKLATTDQYVLSQNPSGFVYMTEPKVYRDVNNIVQAVAKEFGISVLWGGWWRMRDYSHWQLSTPEEVDLVMPKPKALLPDLSKAEGPRAA